MKAYLTSAPFPPTSCTAINQVSQVILKGNTVGRDEASITTRLRCGRDFKIIRLGIENN